MIIVNSSIILLLKYIEFTQIYEMGYYNRSKWYYRKWTIFREGLKLLLSVEETHEFAKNTITKHKTHLKLEPKIGKLTYLFRRYEKLSRCIISINEQYYLLLAMDFEENNFDKL